jgi:hypothetical protein
MFEYFAPGENGSLQVSNLKRSRGNPCESGLLHLMMCR